MTSKALENLVSIGQLVAEPGSKSESDNLVAAARKKLKDAKIASLSVESKFQLAYSAAYGFALAALRNAGYRAKNRYIVFQSLGTTLNLPKPMVMVLDQCHRKRNLAEYEGVVDVEQALLAELINVCDELNSKF